MHLHGLLPRDFGAEAARPAKVSKALVRRNGSNGNVVFSVGVPLVVLTD